MQFTNLFDDDRAVSPVIGVILMVAITVILAAVIGTFVLGMSDQMGDNAPRASFGFDYDSGLGELTITHESGASIDPANLKIAYDGAPTNNAWNDFNGGTAHTSVDAGKSIVVGDGTEPAPAGTVRVVYGSPDSDSTTTLQKFEVPN